MHKQACLMRRLSERSEYTRVVLQPNKEKAPTFPCIVTHSDVIVRERESLVKTIRGLLRHAKASTTLDLYSQAIDESKLEAQRDIALAITSNQTHAD